MLETYQPVQPSDFRGEETEASGELEFSARFVASRRRHYHPPQLALIPRLVVAVGMLFIVHSDSQI